MRGKVRWNMGCARLKWLVGALAFAGCSSRGVDSASGGATSSGGQLNALGGQAAAGAAQIGGTLGSAGSSSFGGITNRAGDSSSLPKGLPASCPGPCDAAPPAYPTVGPNDALGNVTVYTTAASAGGACLYGNTQVKFFAAMSVNVEPGDGRGHWQMGRICGQCARVTTLTSRGAQQVVVRIMDKCPDGFCGIDLGGAAPQMVMSDGFGRYDGAWEFISCAGHDEVFDGPTALYVKDGSNPYWAAIQVRNPLMSVTTMRWQEHTNPARSGTFEYAAPQIENFYLVPSEVLQANALFDITATYRDGSSVSIGLTSAQLSTPESSYAF